MDAPWLQVVSASPAPEDGDAAEFAAELARAQGGTVLSLQPWPAEWEGDPAWRGVERLAPEPGEGALAAWHRALDAVKPGVVLVHQLGAVRPGLLLDLRERGIPHAVFLHDYTPICPTHQLWHRRQERCSGPGRTGWKCAWCVSGTWRRAAELPVRTLLYRHRPQEWRTALLRADALIVDSRFGREFWIGQGAPPERIAVIPPWGGGTAAKASAVDPAPAEAARVFLDAGVSGSDGAELLLAALEQVGRPLRIEVAGPEFALADPLPARHAIRFHGRMTPAARLALMAGCDAVALPLRWEAPYSRLAAEAQRAGVAVVATAVGGLVEQIAHGVNGYLAASDDPVALAESLTEALERPAPAWGGERVAAQSRTQAAEALQRVDRLRAMLRQGEADAALRLEHGDWLAAHPETDAAALGAALRRVEEDEHENRPDPAQRRARLASRHRRTGLNHALAFFRACGCRRVVHLDESGDLPDDVGACFIPWGIELVAATELPDGIFVEMADSGDLTRWSVLRRRFPQAKALVVFNPATIETEAWLD